MMTLARMLTMTTASLAVSLGLTVSGCGNEHDHDHEGDHSHGDGDASAHEEGEGGHEHGEEVSLGTTTIGDDRVECWQGHGGAAPGKELHLVVKLPYSDDGATTVRAWIGTEDRLASMVAKGQYAPSHGDYDLHAMAPDPLPGGARWWIEIEKPDGTSSVGSIALK
jgi:hypothetical protein